MSVYSIVMLDRVPDVWKGFLINSEHRDWPNSTLGGEFGERMILFSLKNCIFVKLFSPKQNI